MRCHLKMCSWEGESVALVDVLHAFQSLGHVFHDDVQEGFALILLEIRTIEMELHVSEAWGQSFKV